MQHKDQVWKLLQQGALIYVCGDASKMAPDVRHAFATTYQEKARASEQETEQWLNDLTNDQRYLVDIWPVLSIAWERF